MGYGRDSLVSSTHQFVGAKGQSMLRGTAAAAVAGGAAAAVISALVITLAVPSTTPSSTSLVAFDSRNSHLPMPGYAFTDSSMSCTPCYGGPGCSAGCLVGGTGALAIKGRQHRLSILRAQHGSGELKGGSYHAALGEGHAWRKYGGTHPCVHGHCGTPNSRLGSLGVNVDSMGGAMRVVPLPNLDPSSHDLNRRRMAQRSGRYAGYDAHTRGQVTWGGDEGHRYERHSRDALERAGVNVRGRLASAIPGMNYAEDHSDSGSAGHTYTHGDHTVHGEHADRSGDHLPGASTRPSWSLKDHMVQYQSIPELRDAEIVTRLERPMSNLLADAPRHPFVGKQHTVVDEEHNTEVDWDSTRAHDIARGRRNGWHGRHSGR